MYREVIDYQPRNSEELFRDTLSRDDKDRNFRTHFPPIIEPGAPVTMLPDNNDGSSNWQFEEYIPRDGIVVIKVPSEQNPKAYYKREELPLLVFYLLNPNAAPPELSLPLQYYLEVWDTYTPDPSKRAYGKYGDEMSDEIWAALTADPDCRERQAMTLFNIEAGKTKVRQLTRMLETDNQATLPQDKCPFDLIRRDTLFGKLAKEAEDQRTLVAN
ncbi:MAG: hypothetical protein PHI73_00795 [Patescibacteria group bacterium]|nr:hypothetical protein [Patescibacteria group bacterium]